MAVAAKDIKGMVEGCSLLFICIDTIMKSPHCRMSSRIAMSSTDVIDERQCSTCLYHLPSPFCCHC